ncbi:Solute carrier family 25 member 40 [Babesia sp. Xinjiang]|uniref:Solute carrier family 25 member 40 n=1 Tax=Babesia sp. Xinjiang TaxID=462227 RepID=UPI000A25F61F|nr:Solute carrier family 25 member 40 [Babesia sp. Xinjiang]ORM40670.1 Solute carrier family 25 member 40 [Babesia sp. Xinjiang]
MCVPTDVVRNYWYFNPELKGIRGNVSTIGVARRIYATHGVRCFFTGFHLTAMNVVGGQTLFFLSYDKLKGEVSSPLASVLGRMVTLLSMQPLECLRTFKQANLAHRTVDFFSGTRGLQSFLSLYKGLTPTVIRDVPFSAVHWPLNDWLYRRFIAFNGLSECDLSKPQRLALSLVTGSISSTAAAVISQPFDIVKTTIQASTDRTVKMTVRRELIRFFGQYGMKGFSIGLTPRLIKIVPGCAIISGCYRYFN